MHKLIQNTDTNFIFNFDNGSEITKTIEINSVRNGNYRELLVTLEFINDLITLINSSLPNKSYIGTHIDGNEYSLSEISAEILDNFLYIHGKLVQLSNNLNISGPYIFKIKLNDEGNNIFKINLNDSMVNIISLYINNFEEI